MAFRLPASVPLPSRRWSATRAPVLGALALLPLLLAVGCKEPPRPPRPATVVAVRPADRGRLPYLVRANGEVEAGRTVAIQSLVSGMLTDVRFTEGDEVAAGQVLFQVDPRPFQAALDRARGALARDEAVLGRARADSARFAQLARDGYVTQQQLDQAYAEAGAAAATVSADRAAVQAAAIDLENTTIRAPIAGRTGQLALKAGNLVRAQAEPPLVTINALRPVFVRFSVPEREFAELRARAGLERALRVAVRAEAGDSAPAVSGRLAFVDNVVDKATGSVLLKAQVANEARALWPGQFVTVAMELAVDTAAVTVPAAAVVTSARGAAVFVLADGTARRVPVTVGRQVGDLVVITDGLAGGEPVIVEGQTRLADGARVELRDGAGASGPGGGRRGGGNGSGRPGPRGATR
jgi:multidrug efflux system membrane fusion protein